MIIQAAANNTVPIISVDSNQAGALMDCTQLLEKNMSLLITYL
jgi:hypothetical protein